MTRIAPQESNAFTRLTSLLCHFKWGVIALLVFCTAFFFWQMQGLTFDNSEDIWFVKGDPSLEQIQKFRNHFGNDDFVYLIFDSPKIFTPESLKLLGKLTHELKKNVPHVKDVTWLGNAEHMEGKEQTIVISDFFNPDKIKSKDILDIKRRALDEKMYRDSLISADARTLGILMEMTDYPKDIQDPRSEIAPKVHEILDAPLYKGLESYVVGQPILHYDYNMLSLTESRFFFGICLLIQITLLFGLTRDIRGVIIPLAVVVLSVVWTMGMIHVLGYTLNLFIILVPTLLVCISIGDSMHIIASFNQIKEKTASTREAMIQAIGKVGPPCLLTSITTAAGFLAFNAADIRPFREMGIYAAIGAIMAFVLSLILIPLAYIAFCKHKTKPDAAPKAAKKKDFFDTILLWIYRINVAAPRRILAVFILLLAVFLFGYTLVEVETNTARMLSPDLALRQAYDNVDERMGGSMSVEIMFDTGSPNGIKEPDFLRKMEEMQNRLDDISFITKTVSVIDILKKINQSMHEGREEYHILPHSQNTVAQYMLLYEMSNGQEMDKLVSFKNDVARLTAKTKTLGTKQVRELSQQVEKISQELFGNDVAVEMSGNLFWVKAMNDLLGEGQQKSFLTAIIVISIIIAICLRSLRLGLISIIPNVFPVVATLGLMGFCKLYMDMPLMSFSAIIIGVAVDDTIHFLFRFRKEFSHLGSYEHALKSTLASVGRPLTFTTLTLTAGFGVLLFSNLTGVAKFGGLAGFAFTWALLADFFFVPSLLLIFKPLGAETISKTNTAS
ncbi:MAG: MMPL family transporter [Pseudodesulfovibrio sp.]|nr:MMPL family transporter [Pseudodesulfovibrio sp.]